MWGTYKHTSLRKKKRNRVLCSFHGLASLVVRGGFFMYIWILDKLCVIFRKQILKP